MQNLLFKEAGATFFIHENIGVFEY